METSVPEGVSILLELGALDTPSARGAKLASASARTGTWSCVGELCVPEEGAELVLPLRGKGPVRMTFLVDEADPGSALVIDDEPPLPLRARADQVSIVRPEAQAAARTRIAVTGRAALVAVAVAKVVAELPPPAPEPWDAGVPAPSP